MELTLQHALGYLAAITVGISLGLIGSGGSIMAVPVLVYLMGVEPVLATAYSLFIVGFSALTGAIQFLRKKMIHLQTAILFAIPSLITVFITRKYIVPAIPDEVLTFSGFTLTKNAFIMGLFALLMLATAVLMIRNKKNGNPSKPEVTSNPEHPITKSRLTLLIFQGIIVGLITGLVGVGGGFLIIPALVLFANLPMKSAVGTSLLIITAKSLIGFLGDIGNQTIDWGLLVVFTAFALSGIFIGIALSKKISGDHLKTGFGWFMILLSLFIVYKEFIVTE